LPSSSSSTPSVPLRMRASASRNALSAAWKAMFSFLRLPAMRSSSDAILSAINMIRVSSTSTTSPTIRAKPDCRCKPPWAMNGLCDSRMFISGNPVSQHDRGTKIPGQAVAARGGDFSGCLGGHVQAHADNAFQVGNAAEIDVVIGNVVIVGVFAIEHLQVGDVLHQLNRRAAIDAAEQRR